MIRAITVHVQWLHYISIPLCIQCTKLYVYRTVLYRTVRAPNGPYRILRVSNGPYRMVRYRIVLVPKCPYPIENLCKINFIQKI